MKRKYLLFCLLVCLFPHWVFTQNSDVKAKEINLYINCQAYCDIDYIKTEISSVNYIIDRFEANIHLHIISESTGSGQKINMFFEGQKEFTGINDTLTYFILDTETSDIARQRMVSKLKIVLVRYFAFTPYVSKLEIKLPPRDTSDNSSSGIKQTDNWKSWIFDIGTGGNINKDDYQSSKSIRSSFSASKTTEQIKLSSYNSLSITSSKWKYEDEEIIVNKNRALDIKSGGI